MRKRRRSVTFRTIRPSNCCPRRRANSAAVCGWRPRQRRADAPTTAVEVIMQRVRGAGGGPSEWLVSAYTERRRSAARRCTIMRIHVTRRHAACTLATQRCRFAVVASAVRPAQSASFTSRAGRFRFACDTATRSLRSLGVRYGLRQPTNLAKLAYSGKIFRANLGKHSSIAGSATGRYDSRGVGLIRRTHVERDDVRQGSRYHLTRREVIRTDARVGYRKRSRSGENFEMDNEFGRVGRLCRPRGGTAVDSNGV